MAESIEVQFGTGENNRITLMFLGRKYPDSKDSWFANWLSVQVAIRVSMFSANVIGETRNEHLHDFYRKLREQHDSLSGSANFGVEKWVDITIAMQKHGEVLVYGSVIDDQDDGNTLQYSIKTDQSYLNQSLKQLHVVVSAYPVIHSEK